MKTFITPLCIMLSACMLIITACKKPNQQPDPRLPDCKVVKLKGNLPDNDSIVISYNSKGNPVSMTRSRVGTGAPNYILRYDKKNRITDVIGAYEGNLHFEVWHHYEYDHTNRVILDSIYKFGGIGNGPLPEFPTDVEQYTTFKYDSYNRIIKTVDVSKIYPYRTWTTLYNYNDDGNLASIVTIYPEGPSTTTFTNYDDKVNLRQLHPVWQLIDKDYSVNNAFTAQTYNAQGLPTLIDGKEYGSAFLGIYFYGSLDVSYKCR